MQQLLFDYNVSDTSAEMLEVIEIFKQINATKSTNKKKQILLDNADNELFKKCLKYAISNDKQFYIKAVKRVKSNRVFNADEFFRMLDYLNDKGSATKKEKEALFEMISGNDEIFEWCSRIIKKNLRIGVSSKLASLIIDDIKDDICMLCEEDEYIKYAFNDDGKAIVEPKLDGCRCIIRIDKITDKVEYISRNYKKFDILHYFDDKMVQLVEKIDVDVVELDCEITTKNGDFQDLMKLLFRKKVDVVRLCDIVFNIFDIIIPNVRLEDRKNLLWKLNFDGITTKIITGCKVFHEAEAWHEMEYYVKCGFEGAVVKNPDSYYEFKRSKKWVKLKPMKTIDVQCIDVFEGEGKNVGMLGGIIVDVNGVMCRVGSGFTDDEKRYYWKNKNEIVGKIVEIQYQQKTNDGSLRFPVFLRVRDDKS
jgi:DNA ligase-1